MVKKFADFVIKGVHYDDRGSSKSISTANVFIDLGDYFGTGGKVSRESIINFIDAGFSFHTVVLGDEGWEDGKNVIVEKIEGKRYIKTESNNTTKDNLDGILEY